MPGFIDSIRDRIARFQHRADEATAPALFAGYLFFSLVLLLLTAGADLGTIAVKANNRTKGFFWELNWGLNHVLLIPVGLFCCALVLREVRRQIDKISGAHMAVDGTFHEIPLDDLRSDWLRARPGPWWFGIVVGLSFLEAWIEWWVGSCGPVFGFRPAEMLESTGWTAGALLDPTISKFANVSLSFVAFTAQGFVVAVFCYTVVVVLGFANWIYEYADSSQRRIVPNTASGDVRRGFEEFEPLMFRLLYMALVFTFVVFTIRMQIVYNFSKSDLPTALDFVLRDMASGFFVKIGEVLQGKQTDLDLFAVSLPPAFGTIIACTAMIVLVSLVTMIPTSILSSLARESRRTMIACLGKTECPACSAQEISKDECARRLDGMDFWPMRYPRQMELVAYVVFSLFCFLFYKFTVVLFGVFVMRLVIVAYKGLTSRVPAN